MEYEELVGHAQFAALQPHFHKMIRGTKPRQDPGPAPETMALATPIVGHGCRTYLVDKVVGNDGAVVGGPWAVLQQVHVRGGYRAQPDRFHDTQKTVFNTSQIQRHFAAATAQEEAHEASAELQQRRQTVDAAVEAALVKAKKDGTVDPARPHDGELGHVRTKVTHLLLPRDGEYHACKLCPHTVLCDLTGVGALRFE